MSSEIINLNDTTPAAPAGRVNVAWQKGASSGTDPATGLPIYPVSANVASADEGSIGVVVDGSGGVPSTGSKGFVQMPFAGTITGWTILADRSGSAQFDVKKSTYAGFPTTTSIVASAPPTLSSAQNATSSTLTGWTTTFAAGDILEFVLSSAATLTRAILQLTIQKS